MSCHPGALRRSFRPEVESLEDRCLLDAAHFTTEPIIPVIDALTKDHLRAILADGLAQGNRPNVFAKVGDSNTSTPLFLADLGAAWYNPYHPAFTGAFTHLAPTIDYFRIQVLDATGANSFNRTSRAAVSGWLTYDVLNPARNLDPLTGGPATPPETPLHAEIRLIRPAFALIMLGTNDLFFESNPAGFARRLTTIAQEVIAQGVIPVLSTIPDYLAFNGIVANRVPMYNQVIVQVATGLDVPLWNYWRALELLPNRGLSRDAVHPSYAPAGAGLFTAEAVAHGFNLRNLTAVEVLDKLRRIVLEDGPPDVPATPVPQEIINFVSRTYLTVLGREAEPAALSIWAHLIHDGFPRSQMVQALWHSAEHRGLQVDQYFATFLGRRPDPATRSYWVDVFLTGVREQDVQRAILTSIDFLREHSSDVEFAAALYRGVLGREADPHGLAYWQWAMQQGLSRIQLVNIFLTTREEYGQVINSMYTSYLHRVVDPAGEQFWLGLLQGGLASEETLAITLLTSDEYWVLPK